MTSSDRRRSIGLEYLSVFGMPLLDYVRLAADIGYDFISVHYGKAANRLDERHGETLRESARLRRDFGAAVRAHGLRIELVEGFPIMPGLDVEQYSADLDAVAEMGGRTICAVSLDKDLGHTNTQFATLAEMAETRGLLVTTEVGAGVMRNFDVARAAWQDVAHPNFKLLIDTMHFFRRAASVDDLAAIPCSAIGHIQLCDVPMPSPMANYLEEALFERRAPGDGDLPLEDFLKKIPAEVPIGLEIPIRSEQSAGLAAKATLQRCLAAAEAVA